MRTKLLTIGVLTLLFAFIWTRCFSETHTIQSASTIKNLPEFLEENFDGKVLELQLNAITKPGDNYNSKIGGLQVKIMKNSDNLPNEVETLELVFKTMRAGAVSARKSQQFMNELHFYTDIIQAIEQFEVDVNMPVNEKINAFARYYGSRLSLNSNVKSADADAILLMKNIKSLNFTSPNRWNRFDKDEVFACLKQLAKLHASCIAMRRLQPTLYNSKVNPYLHTDYNDSYIDVLIKSTEDFYVDNLPSTFPNMSSNLRSAIEQQFEISKKSLRDNVRTQDTPYTTFYHRDLWMKNFMIKRDETGANLIRVKIVDFQAYDYNSFAFDLIHFLCLNVRIDDLKMRFKAFVDYYLLEFANVMRLANCPLDDYTHEKLWNEINEKAKHNLFNLYMYLAAEKTEIDKLLYNSSISLQSTDSNLQQPVTSDIVFNRWKCIHDLYTENNFISIQ